MTGTNLRFYEELAAHCHLICDDWNEAIERQAQVLGPLIHSHANGNCLRVFDCSCGIGTQSLGFAKLAYSVLVSDLCLAAKDRKEGRHRQSAFPRPERVRYDACGSQSSRGHDREITWPSEEILSVRDGTSCP
jgi:hypothetical protein